jgi:hypothetical protein
MDDTLAAPAGASIVAISAFQVAYAMHLEYLASRTKPTRELFGWRLLVHYFLFFCYFIIGVIFWAMSHEDKARKLLLLTPFSLVLDVSVSEPHKARLITLQSVRVALCRPIKTQNVLYIDYNSSFAYYIVALLIFFELLFLSLTFLYPRALIGAIIVHCWVFS